MWENVRIEPFDRVKRHEEVEAVQETKSLPNRHRNDPLRFEVIIKQVRAPSFRRNLLSLKPPYKEAVQDIHREPNDQQFHNLQPLHHSFTLEGHSEQEQGHGEARDHDPSFAPADIADVNPVDQRSQQDLEDVRVRDEREQGLLTESGSVRLQDQCH
jgi:hypothetical protein